MHTSCTQSAEAFCCRVKHWTGAHPGACHEVINGGVKFLAGGQCDQYLQRARSGGKLLLPERHGGGQSTAAAHQRVL